MKRFALALAACAALGLGTFTLPVRAQKPEKPDAGSHALNDAADLGHRHPGLERRDREQRRAHGNQDMRSQSGGLAFALAFPAEQSTQQACDE